MQRGNNVVYIHFEESNPASTIERLRALDVDDYVIAKHLHFASPSQRLATTTWLQLLLDAEPSLMIIDDVNAGMSLQGNEINAADGAANFTRSRSPGPVPPSRPATTCRRTPRTRPTRSTPSTQGPSCQGRGSSSFGRSHWVAAWTAQSVVYVTKDRPGWLREKGTTTDKADGAAYMGTLVVDASRHGNPRVEFYGPREEDQGAFAGGEKVSRGDRGAADRAAVLKVIQNAPGGSMDPVRQVLAAVKIAELNIPREHFPALLDELVQLGDLTAGNGVRNSTSYDSNPLHERLHEDQNESSA
ncbi:MAG: hypothetical protein V3W34_05940 [Phycisphaerae bacterium]